MDGVITLISCEPQTQDAYGVWRDAAPVRREVFCRDLTGITRSEFFNAGRNGLNPEFSVQVFAADYEGEQVVEYGGKLYAVYRTYRRPDNDYIELYCQREGGTNSLTTTAAAAQVDNQQGA